MENFFKKVAVGASLLVTQAAEGQAAHLASQQPENAKPIQEKNITVDANLLNVPLKEILKKNEAIYKTINFRTYTEQNKNIAKENKIDSVFSVKTDWLKDYLRSTQYRRMLIKEFMHAHTSGDINAMVDSCIQSRLDRIDDPHKNVVKRSFDSEDKKDLGYYNKDTVYISKKQFKFDGTNTITHEKDHQLTDGNKGLFKVTRQEIQDRVWGDARGYFDNPTEVHARLIVLKQLCSENHIYDPFTEKFTLEHFKDIMQNPDIMSSQDVFELLFNVKTADDLIWLMNNLA